MTKYKCALCGRTFLNPDLAYDHVVDKHAEKIESEYIVEVRT